MKYKVRLSKTWYEVWYGISENWHKVGYTLSKIGLMNGYDFEASMARPRSKCGQVHPRAPKGLPRLLKVEIERDIHKDMKDLSDILEYQRRS